jgi:hypothetical protein
MEYSQLFFPIKGIIAVYDRDSKKYYELPGASDPDYVQSNPNWSPDSREVMLARADRYRSPKIENSASVLLNLADVQEFVSREQDFKFNLYPVLPKTIKATISPGIHLMVNGWCSARLKISCCYSTTANYTSCRPAEANPGWWIAIPATWIHGIPGPRIANGLFFRPRAGDHTPNYILHI